jgi:cytochrome c biogenesis protein CcdA
VAVLGDLGFATAAGTVAAVNPCGFAMLPAYLALFARCDDRGSTVARAGAASAAVTLGFLTVFGIVGVLLAPIAVQAQRWSPALTVLIGAGLVAMGWAMARGRAVKLPGVGRLGPRGAITDNLASMYRFGLSYAVASLGCALGPFLIVVGGTLRAGDMVRGTADYLAYAVGMGLVVTLVAVGGALLGEAGRGRVRGVGTVPNGLLVMAVGLYLSWYGSYELRLSHGGAAGDPVVDGAGRVQNCLGGLIDRAGPGALAGALLALVAVAQFGRRPRTYDADTKDCAPAPHPPP